MNERIIEVSTAIHEKRYGGALATFAAGSIVRGEGTPFSDLDLVVVFAELPCAYRESFRFDGYPVEAFVHDPATLEYFFLEVDRPSGVPTLPQMVVEGIEIPASSDVSRELKRQAISVIEAGPPPLDSENERRMRYFVSDLLDDLRASRSQEEALGTGARLYEELADYHLRRRGLWSAKGKGISRILKRADPALCANYHDAFAVLFATGDAAAVIRLAEDLLKEAGGPLFEGYRSDAPSSWRRPSNTAVQPRLAADGGE